MKNERLVKKYYYSRPFVATLKQIVNTQREGKRGGIKKERLPTIQRPDLPALVQ